MSVQERGLLCEGQYPVYRTEAPGIGWTQEMADVETSHGNRYDYQNGRVLPMGGFDDVVSKAVLHSDDPSLTVTVYDIEVEDCHTSYVGETGFWVHNTNCEGIVPSRRRAIVTAAQPG